MKTDHYQSSLWRKDFFTALQRPFNFCELAVDKNPDCLKCAGRRMFIFLPGWMSLLENFR